MRGKKTIAFLFIFLISGFALCQLPRKNFNPDSLDEIFFSKLKTEFGKNKQYPAQYERQILIALSYYPELKNTPIIFRTRIMHTIGFTRATWTGVFEPREKRHFVIAISEGTEPALTPLLFKNLSFNAQVGVIGHELGHVVEFSNMTTLQIIAHAIKNVSAKYIDRFEYGTDSICIAHGLGYQLLEWSSFVRRKMNRKNWMGPDYIHRPMPRERYMNPSTILKRINDDPVYRSVQ
jgi:hypothetical protein